jgi:uncharacterized protein (DUF1800 family)
MLISRVELNHFSLFESLGYQMKETEKIAHLLRRAGFGPGIRDRWPLSVNETLDDLFASIQPYEELYLPDEERIGTSQLIAMTPEERKVVLEDLAANVKKLNLEWLKLMGRTNAQLREKAALFWHGHFAVRVRNYPQVESYINTIRRHALGKFGDLLMAVSKEPAMLRFLNNVQNRKKSPNENFARELMELFTLGRGHYTEQDIRESARAFTGWGVNDSDEFERKDNQHDFGQKTFMGNTGNWDGEDIIRMILEKPETALFITRKLYRFFINQQEDEQMVALLAKRYYESGYDTAELLRHIFSSDFFYAAKNKASIIKSPVELLVQLNRIFGISYQNATPLLGIQRLLGQTLFFPPNVSGWAGGRNWIDNSTLITRLNLPKRLSESDVPDLDYKQQMNDENPSEGRGKPLKNKLICYFNWDKFEEPYANMSKEDVWGLLCSRLLATEVKPLIPNERQQEQFIREFALQLVRLPEFQLS